LVGAVEKDLRRGSLSGFSVIANGLLVDAQNILCRRRIIRTIKENKFISRCYAGNLAGVLLSDGKVMPCELRSETFGNIRDQSFPTLWRSKEAKEFEKVCDTCYCTHECFIGPNIIFNGRYSLAVFLLAGYLGAIRNLNRFPRMFGSRTDALGSARP
jgi:hypothetical protein